MRMRFPLKKSSSTFITLIITISLTNVHEVDGDKKTKPEATTTETPKKIHCCARQQKVIDVGHGISGDLIKIDAGYCKSFCPRHLFDDPGDASRPAVQKCMPNMLCRPRTARLERISTIQGVRTIEVVETCDCSSAYACRRDPYTIALHTGTPYQVEIDIGICIGACRKYSCKPSRNATISVRGPNGDEIYPIIDRCSCAGNCHRMDHMETVLDFSGIEIRESMNIADARPIVKQINVGKCVGTCSTNNTETCIIHDKKNPTNCLAGLFTDSQNCTPAKFKVIEYRTRRGIKREIIQITQCACV
ncbi:uncharacterized protein LOC131664773 [Phymastichus coffea]|uniref:uncharacterized protein LOC131664773 n=1 Tax=Phymastichus coffea TaxID=108790 RepID=UPI00273AC649|nr:uncharacterized protein LOC131664773 [Phymastichus coffea]